MAKRVAAFPEYYDTSGATFDLPGMSRHLWVATHVLQGLLAGKEGNARHEVHLVRLMTGLAWQYANDMIAIDERYEQGGGA